MPAEQELLPSLALVYWSTEGGEPPWLGKMTSFQLWATNSEFSIEEEDAPGADARRVLLARATCVVAMLGTV